MTDKKISNLMLPLQSFQSISSSTVASSLISLFINDSQEKLTRTLLLVYENNYLVGYIDHTCFLKPIEPQKLEGFSARGRNIPWSIPVFWEGLFYDRCQYMTSLSAEQLMKPFNINIDINDSLVKAAYIMNSNGLKLLPVSDQDCIVGILTDCLIVTEVINAIKPIQAQIIDINDLISKSRKVKMSQG